MTPVPLLRHFAFYHFHHFNFNASGKLHHSHAEVVAFEDVPQFRLDDTEWPPLDAVSAPSPRRRALRRLVPPASVVAEVAGLGDFNEFFWYLFCLILRDHKKRRPPFDIHFLAMKPGCSSSSRWSACFGSAWEVTRKWCCRRSCRAGPSHWTRTAQGAAWYLEIQVILCMPFRFRTWSPCNGRNACFWSMGAERQRPCSGDTWGIVLVFSGFESTEFQLLGRCCIVGQR